MKKSGFEPVTLTLINLSHSSHSSSPKINQFHKRNTKTYLFEVCTVAQMSEWSPLGKRIHTDTLRGVIRARLSCLGNINVFFIS